jgi:hypothetical protein
MDAQGALAYQQLPCAADQTEGSLRLAPEPAYAPSPQYRIEAPTAQRVAYAARERRDSPERATSWECRASDGQVFYRHSTCPRSIAADATATHIGGRNPSRSNHGEVRGNVPVTSRRIPREEACAQIHAAGAVGRSGHEHDDDVGTYERNLGRDPCR